MTVVAGDTEGRVEVLHDLDDLWPCHVFREYLQILWRWLGCSAATLRWRTRRRSLWCLCGNAERRGKHKNADRNSK
jgi:hypothetical protein